MRKPSEIAEKYFKGQHIFPETMSLKDIKIIRDKVLLSISEAQKEAWNEAIELAAKEARTRSEWRNLGSESCYENVIDENSILKLRK